MSKKGRLFYKVFKRVFNKRFRMVKADGTPLELPKKTQNEDGLSEEKLTDEEIEEMELTEEELQEEKLASEIGNFLDELVEKIESGEEERSESKSQKHST